CFWNMENFFDDRDDHRAGADKEYDGWFAHDPSALREKLDHLSAALVKMNDGKGPDIFAGVEVESERAAELLRDALNERLSDTAADYANQIECRFRAMYKSNPAVDFLVCGDFNDPPDAESVAKHLHATANAEAVRTAGDPPLLLDLLADKDPNRYGTHYYHKW